MTEKTANLENLMTAFKACTPKEQQAFYRTIDQMQTYKAFESRLIKELYNDKSQLYMAMELFIGTTLCEVDLESINHNLSVRLNDLADWIEELKTQINQLKAQDQRG